MQRIMRSFRCEYTILMKPLLITINQKNRNGQRSSGEEDYERSQLLDMFLVPYRTRVLYTLYATNHPLLSRGSQKPSP